MNLSGKEKNEVLMRGSLWDFDETYAGITNPADLEKLALEGELQSLQDMRNAPVDRPVFDVASCSQDLAAIAQPDDLST